MGLFTKVNCAECGCETKPLLRTKLKDGNYICSKCARIIPLYAYQTFLESYSLEDFCVFKQHKVYSDEALRPNFEETDSYQTLHMDSLNGLFYIGYAIDKDTIFLQFKDIVRFELFFNPKELKNGIIGQKVEGDVLFQLEMKHPYFKYEAKLDKDVKAKVKKELFGTKVTYENPKGMDEFAAAFTYAWVLDSEAATESASVKSYQSAELQQAMALFMLDNLDGITLEELKSHRNRLIKAFHPDKGSADDTRYAQKINNAYEVLKSFVDADA